MWSGKLDGLTRWPGKETTELVDKDKCDSGALVTFGEIRGMQRDESSECPTVELSESPHGGHAIESDRACRGGWVAFFLSDGQAWLCKWPELPGPRKLRGRGEWPGTVGRPPAL